MNKSQTSAPLLKRRGVGGEAEGKYNRALGNKGEEIALKYLQQKNYQIIEQNFSCKWGEIDLIALKNNKLYFIEVKTRTSLKKGRPEEAINRRKFQSLTRTVHIYLNKYQLHTHPWQVDVLAILLDNAARRAKIKHIPNVYIDTTWGYKVR